MRTAAQRIAKYNARMQSTQLDPVLVVMNEQQAANHTAHVLYFYPRQQALRDLLSGQGLTTTEMFAYEAYNGELYHLVRTGAVGTALVAEKEVLVAKYTAAGLTPALLQSIALTVWEIPEAGLSL